VLSGLMNPVLAQTETNPAISLASADVLGCQLFLYKHAWDKPSGWLRVQITPGKIAEYSTLAAGNPQKEVGLLLNGKLFLPVEATPPKMETSLDLKITSADDAFAAAEAVMSPPTTPAPVLTPVPGEPVFSLVPDDVAKVVISLFREHTQLEVTFVKSKQEEFAKTAGENLQKKGEIILNGKRAGEMTITKPTLGHSIKVEMPSPAEAFTMAQQLIDPTPKK
jgi:hypothetical protein